MEAVGPFGRARRMRRQWIGIQSENVVTLHWTMVQYALERRQGACGAMRTIAETVPYASFRPACLVASGHADRQEPELSFATANQACESGGLCPRLRGGLARE